MIRNILIAAILMFATSAFAQTAPTGDEQRTEMKKLEQMVGQWKGSGWIMQNAKRETFTGTENVQSKLGGLALLVEGKYTNDKGAVIHETFGVISYEPKKKNYRFSTYLASGVAGEQELTLVEGGWQWGIQFPSGSIRYTTKMSNDEWFETGEISQDGKNWRQFFEMKLQRVK